MNQRQELEALLHRAVAAAAAGGPLDAPTLACAIDHISDDDLLAVARDATSKEAIYQLLLAMWEERMHRMNNRELVRLAYCVTRHGPLFGKDGRTPAALATETLVEILLERFDDDVGLPREAKLQIILDEDEDEEAQFVLTASDGTPCHYEVDARDHFVHVTSWK